MKKALKITGIVVLFLVILITVSPFLFKDKAKALVNQEIAKNVNAHVRYRDLSLSLWQHFPYLTIGLQEFSVVGKSPFTGDTLVSARELRVAVNALSLLRGTQIKIQSIDLETPQILVKVLKDSSANYQIFNQTTATTDTAQSAFSVGIQSWQINDGRITYDDRLQGIFVQLNRFSQTGEGDFTQDVFNLTTRSQSEAMTAKLNGVSYLNNQKIALESTTKIDVLASQYDFKATKLIINEFPLEINGFVALPDTNIHTNIQFKALSDDLKELFSLVPGAYTANYAEVKADGKIAFNGEVVGTYNARQFPAFLVNLSVKNGRVQYPNLPKPLEQINVEATFKNSTDQLENTLIEVRNLAFLLGNNPVKGRVLWQGLKTAKIDADFAAKLNLEDLTQVFPMAGQTLRGLANINLKAKGIYDGLTQFPVINAVANLTNGYVKTSQFPEPLENITFKGILLNRNGKIEDTRLDINELRLMLQQETFEAKGSVSNFADYNWDVEAKGKLDLGKITAIFPIENTKLAGKITTDLRTKGRLSDVKAQRYANLNTTGQASIANLEYTTPAYPVVKIQAANLQFTPRQINFANANGTVGSSDFAGKGQLSNYLGYALNNETIEGDFTVASRSFNVNEWMSDSPTATDSTHKTVVEIPKDVRLTLHPTVGEARYDQMKMRNLAGVLLVENGTIKINNVAFNALGGQFLTNGTYDSRDLAHPKFDFGLDLTKIDLGQAYQHLRIVRALVPIVEYLIGQVSSKIRINGLLQQDMLPDLNSLTGDGLVKVIQAVFKENNVLMNKMASYSKIDELKKLQLKDALMNVSVKDGKLNVAPFSFNYQDYKLTVSGQNGLNGAVDFKLGFDVPTQKVGTSLGQAFSGWTGKSLTNTDLSRVQFDLGLAGTYANPTFSFKGSNTAKNLKESVVAEVKQQTDALKQQAEERVVAEKERLRQEAETRIKAAQDSINSLVEAKKREAETRVKANIKEQRKRFLDKLIPTQKTETPPKDTINH
ncbi:MAG: hypothetical protein EAZ70_05750 [Runella slithyformis]|nr:MAG: hypothetical protein EAZ70_05750 [Runella slithyformis]